MLKVAVKGLASRRLRAVLTALAIVLGVALVAGTYVLTDSLHSDLGSVYQTIYKNTAASITGRNAIDTGANAATGGDVPSFPESLLARVKQLPGVAEASGGVERMAFISAAVWPVSSVARRSKYRRVTGFSSNGNGVCSKRPRASAT